MILSPKIPKTKTDLIRLLQGQNIQQIDIVEPYDSTREHELLTKTKAMSQRSGEVTIILLRTP